MKQRYNMGYGIYKTKPQQCRKVAARMIHAWDWRMLGNPKHTMPCSMVSIHMLHERSWTYMKVHLFGVCIYIYMYDYMILYVCIICMYNIYIYIHTYLYPMFGQTQLKQGWFKTDQHAYQIIILHAWMKKCCDLWAQVISTILFWS